MAHMEQKEAITEDMIGWEMECREDLLVLTEQDADKRNKRKYIGEEFAFGKNIFLRDRIGNGEDPRCICCDRGLLMLKKDTPREGGEDNTLSEAVDAEEDTENEFIGDECFISPLCDDFHSFICLECFKDTPVGLEEEIRCEHCHKHQCTWLSAYEGVSMHTVGTVAGRRAVAGRRTISFKKGSSVLFNYTYMSMDTFKALLDWVNMVIEEELNVMGEKHTEISFTDAQREKLTVFEEGRIRIHAEKLSLSDENLCVLPAIDLWGVASLELAASEEKNIRELLTRDLGSISTGEKKELTLADYAIGIFPVLELQETEILKFTASKMEHIKELLKHKDNRFSVGGYDTWKYRAAEAEERTILCGYAVNILPLLDVKRITVLELDAPEKEHIEGLLELEHRSIEMGVFDNREEMTTQKIKLCDYAIRILPKFSLEDIRGLELSASKEDHVKELLEGGGNSIYFDEKLDIKLTDYAVGILPKLQKDEIGDLQLAASEKDHIKELLKCDPGSIVNVEGLWVDLFDYAIGILTRLQLKGVRCLWLDSSSAECITEFMKHEDRSIDAGEASIHLENYAVNMLPKLKLNKDTILYLSASNEDHIKEIPKLGCVVCDQNHIDLTDYAVNILAKMKIQNTRSLMLSAEKEEHVKEVLKREDCDIGFGLVEYMEIKDHAVNILPKLKLDGAKRLELYGQEKEHIKEILKYKNNSIEFGGVECVELNGYAVNILLRLRLERVEELRLYRWKGELSKLLISEDCSIDRRENEKMYFEEYLMKMLPKLKIKRIEIDEMIGYKEDCDERILRWGFNSVDVSDNVGEREIRFKMEIRLAKEICSRLGRTGGLCVKVFDLDGKELSWSPTCAENRDENQLRLE
ncbi:MAG: uncharacterized protein A8A55_2176 [Amphiamblys sp. WSBS2006]|nr:MAG: uncharacterized protein A8A55_2176 [Amphiamblys sp. WSBS2006]